jgi:hypothetical protein
MAMGPFQNRRGDHMKKTIIGEVLGYWFMPFAHQALIEITEGLSEAEFAHQPGTVAPPAGWHLFHIARLADRLQATLRSKITEQNYVADLPGQFWVKEGVASQWGIAPVSLGYLEAGIGMSVEDAVRLAEAGKSNLIPYARRAFEAVDQEVAKITDEMLLMPSYSVIPNFTISAEGVFTTIGPDEVTILDQLMFHSVHSQRHLGMIEALVGVVFNREGTATI